MDRVIKELSHLRHTHQAFWRSRHTGSYRRQRETVWCLAGHAEPPGSLNPSQSTTTNTKFTWNSINICQMMMVRDGL